MRAETTIRIELLKFYENLFPDDGSGFRDTSGWKCHFAKDYVQEITKKDIYWFINTTLDRMNINKSKYGKDIAAVITNKLYEYYKFTLDDESIAFVLKSKTIMIRDEVSGFKKFVSKIKKLFSHKNDKKIVENFKH